MKERTQHMNNYIIRGLADLKLTDKCVYFVALNKGSRGISA